jgi:hypothetical protein
MRKTATTLLAFAAIALFGVSAATAAPLFTEDFSYPVGTALNGTGGWAAHSGAGTNPQTVTTAGGLSYAGFPGSAIGALLGPLAPNGEDDNHTFTGQSSGSVYAGLMTNVSAASVAGDYFFHFFDGLITGNNFYTRLFVKSSGAGYVYGLQFKSNTGATCTFYSSTVETFGSTHLVVIKYTFNAGTTNDQAALFIDPVTNCLEPVADVTINNTSVACTGTTVDTDATNIDGVAIRQGGATSGATVELDGIRVATNWVDATCDPATPAKSTTWGHVKTIYR